MIRLVWGNKHLPFSVLTKLTDNRALLARNLQAPVELLQELAKDDVVDVRIEVGLNTSTPDDALCLLLDDPEPEVRAAALSSVVRKEGPAEELQNRALTVLTEPTLVHPSISRFLRLGF